MTVSIQQEITDAKTTLISYPTLQKFLWSGVSMGSEFTSWFKDQISKPTGEQAMLYHLLRKNDTKWGAHLNCLESRLNAVSSVSKNKAKEWKSALKNYPEGEWNHYFSEIEWIGYLATAGVNCKVEFELPKRKAKDRTGPSLDLQAIIVHRPIFFEIKAPGDQTNGLKSVLSLIV